MKINKNDCMFSAFLGSIHKLSHKKFFIALKVILP
jgi:hypothetical protein